eukprot:3616217-Amphidinium_carterae.2
MAHFLGNNWMDVWTEFGRPQHKITCCASIPLAVLRTRTTTRDILPRTALCNHKTQPACVHGRLQQIAVLTNKWNLTGKVAEDVM